MTLRSNKKFVSEQIALAGYVGTPEGYLISGVVAALDKADIEESLAGEVELLVLQALSLFKGQAIADGLETEGETWQQAALGDLAVRSTVRVRLDAYGGSTGVQHNGKRGKVVGFQGVRASVMYDDGDFPTLHFVNALEKLL